jgi:formate dehydrogenase major subunit
LGRAINKWPVMRQLRGADRLARGRAAQSRHSLELIPRTAATDKVVKSVCPFCAVGCGQNVYVTDGAITQIEGDPDSPVSRGRLCPKGAASKQLVTGPGREYQVRYRRARGAEWEDLGLDTAMDMIADRVIDNEENYLMKKLYTALGAIQIENQARI